MSDNRASPRIRLPLLDRLLDADPDSPRDPPLSQSLALGLRRVDGSSIDLPADARSAILLPTGVRGPAFLVSRNYDAIYSYNAAESYALAIALLGAASLISGLCCRKMSWDQRPLPLPVRCPQSGSG